MSDKKLWVDLNDEELQVLSTLQAEMALGSLNDVMRALIWQAHTRVNDRVPGLRPFRSADGARPSSLRELYVHSSAQ